MRAPVCAVHIHTYTSLTVQQRSKVYGLYDQSPRLVRGCPFFTAVHWLQMAWLVGCGLPLSCTRFCIRLQRMRK